MAANYLITTSGSTNWATAANWSLLAVPVSTDAVTLESSAVDIASGLGQGGVTLASLTIPMSFTGSIGLAAQAPKSVTSITRSSSTATATVTAHGYTNGDAVTISGAGESEYNGTVTISNVTTNTFDYTVSGTPTTPATGTIIARRHGYLRIGATSFVYGGSPGNGSGRVKVDFGAIQTAAVILGGKSSGTDTNLEPVRLLGTHASNTLTMTGGTVGIATSAPDEVSTFATISVAGGTFKSGAGLTWTTFYQSDGTVTLKSGGTTFTQGGGQATIDGAGVIANVTVGGTLNLNLRKATAGDTVTGTLWITDGGILDLTGNPADISVGTLRVSGTAKIRRNAAKPGHLTWTTLTQDAGSKLSFE